MSLILAVAGVLRRVQPMTLTGTLPSTATVGTAYTGTLTLAGDFVAPVTITGLASWMTASVSGTTVTVSGTPTAAETDSLTVKATDSSATPQVATSAQSIAVSAAGGGGLPTLVGSYVVTDTGGKGERTYYVDIPDVQAGDQIVIVHGINKKSTAAITVTDSLGTTYTQHVRTDAAGQPTYTGGGAFMLASGVVSGSGAVRVTVSNSYGYIKAAFAAHVVRGGPLTFNAAKSTTKASTSIWNFVDSAPTSANAGSLLIPGWAASGFVDNATVNASAGHTAFTFDWPNAATYFGSSLTATALTGAVFGANSAGGNGNNQNWVWVFEP